MPKGLASLHALRRDRGQKVQMAMVLMQLQIPKHLLHLCWCASLVPGHSGGGKTLQDTSARELGHAFLVGCFLSRFKVCECVCECVRACVWLDGSHRW